MDHSENVFSFAVILLTLCSDVSFGNVSCRAGHFAEGSSASVFCDFGKDVNKTKTNFNVMHYSKFGSNIGSYILLCNWLDSGEIQCTVEDGYSFNYRVGMGLELYVPVVKTAMAGTYMCYLVPSDNISVMPCNLTVTGFSLSTTTLMVTHNHQDFCKDSQEHVQDHTDISGTDTGKTAFITVLVLLLLAILFFVGIIIYLWYNFHLVRRSNSTFAVLIDGWQEFRLCRIFTRMLKYVNVNPRGPLRPEERSSDPEIKENSGNVVEIDNAEKQEKAAENAEQLRCKEKRTSAQSALDHQLHETLGLLSPSTDIDITDANTNGQNTLSEIVGVKGMSDESNSNAPLKNENITGSQQNPNNKSKGSDIRNGTESEV